MRSLRTAQSAGRCLLVVPVRSARSTKSTTSCLRARRRSRGLELEKAGMFQGGCAGRHPLAGRNPQRNPHRPEHKGKAEQQKVAAVHLAVKASRPRPEAPQSVALRLQKQSVLVRRRGVPEKRPQNLRTTRAALQLFSRLGGRRQAFRGGGDGLALLQSAPNTGRGRPPGLQRAMVTAAPAPCRGSPKSSAQTRAGRKSWQAPLRGRRSGLRAD